MNVARLQMMLDFMKDTNFPVSALSLKDWKRDSECGTVACAIGWAASDKRFQDQGFTLIKEGTYLDEHRERQHCYYPIYELPFDEDDEQYVPEESGFEAVMTFFDLEAYVCEDIFYPDGKENLIGEDARQHVINKIETLLKERDNAQS